MTPTLGNFAAYASILKHVLVEETNVNNAALQVRTIHHVWSNC